MAKTTTTAAKNTSKGTKAAAGKKTAKATKITKPAATERKVREGLGKPAIRALVALGKAKAPLTRAELAEKAGIDVAWIKLFVGKKDGTSGGKDDLCEQGLAKPQTQEINGREVMCYTITAKGRQKLQAEKLAK